MVESILDRLPKIEKLRNIGIIRGEETGFKCLDALYSVKQGTYTIIYSEPTHGKSEFSFEICLNQAHEFGKRSLICSPETGTVEEIIAELIHKITGKQIYKTELYHLDDKAFHDALNWLNHLFVIADSDDRSYSIQELFDIADKWEKENPNERINIIVGEPYNELNHDEMSVKFGSRQDLYIEDLMSNVRRSCRKTKRHFILTVHPSGNSVPITRDGITYYPKPLPRQAAGGQALYRKAMTWITLWRPPINLKNEHGQPHHENEVQVSIDKAKPKGVSFRGMCTLYFDWKKNRYYETAWGTNMYAFEQDKPNSVQDILKDNLIMKPSKDFTESARTAADYDIEEIESMVSVPRVDEDEPLPF